MTDQPKFCPHCGNELKPDAQFCPQCGYAVGAALNETAQPDPTPAAQPQPAQTETPTPTARRTANPSGNYFNWYFATLRHPSQNLPGTNRFFGLISLVAEALLLSLTLVMLSQKLTTMAIRTMDQYAAAELSRVLNVNGLIFKTGLTLFFLVIIGYAIYVGISYAFRRIITGESQNFWDFLNHFAGVTNLLLIFNLITFLLGLITGAGNLSSLSIFLLFLVPANILISAAFIFIIIDDVPTPRMDKFYAVLLAELALAVAFAIFGFIAANLVGGSIVSYVESLYNSAL
ncbi:zinc ribbon domain-containing protein [Levilactobacillus suantsaiihabitans]|uniref:Zinc-ribbon domain-containing protein n=1 Tax=Levilactobacillus suantsaiihabitans TaxID=2487722 RepID=A0A4Z0J5V9_9LACO|nr:zinc ribbon domain-containing protein [Levilactobacillus suantsaiihabitans]TGD17808.1 zinc-ribbon domain-containing protein [Levilactobacillus suantsaiihabitans]